MAIIQDALALESKGQRDDAVKKLSRWLESKGKKPPKEARLASFHIARMLLQLGRPGDASAHLSKALTLYKKDAELLNLSGIAAKRRGNGMRQSVFSTLRSRLIKQPLPRSPIKRFSSLN